MYKDLGFFIGVGSIGEHTTVWRYTDSQYAWLSAVKYRSTNVAVIQYPTPRNILWPFASGYAYVSLLGLTTSVPRLLSAEFSHEFMSHMTDLFLMLII